MRTRATPIVNPRDRTDRCARMPRGRPMRAKIKQERGIVSFLFSSIAISRNAASSVPLAFQLGGEFRHCHFRAGFYAGLSASENDAVEVQADIVKAEIHLPIILQTGIDGVYAAVFQPQGNYQSVGIGNEIRSPGDDGARFTNDPVVRDENPFQEISLDRYLFRIQEDSPEIVDEYLLPDADAGLLFCQIK